MVIKESDITSVVWNSKFSDMACFSGKHIFNIKINEFPAHQQRIIVII